MFSKVFGIGLSGIDAYEVSVEVDVSDGLPAFVMVGVLAAEVKEAQDRVRLLFVTVVLHCVRRK